MTALRPISLADRSYAFSSMFSGLAIDTEAKGSQINNPISRGFSEPVPDAATTARVDLVSDRPPANLAEELYLQKSAAKILTAKVSMHMSPQWRARIFEQLDYLLSAEYWDEDSVGLDVQSFTTFLKTILNYKHLPPPLLAISNASNIVAVWKSGERELSCEFFSTGRARILFVQVIDGDREHTAWDGRVDRLHQRLAQFDNTQWLVHG